MATNLDTPDGICDVECAVMEPMSLHEHSLSSRDAQGTFSPTRVPIEESQENQVNNSTEVNHDQRDGSIHKTAFAVDRTKISSVPASQQADELRDLDLVVFNQNEFEEGVIAQVDHALAIQEQERMLALTEKEMKCLSDDLRVVTQELQSIEKVISMLISEAGVNKEVGRQLKAAMQQKQLKLKQVKKINARMKSLCAKLNNSLDDMMPNDNKQKDNELGCGDRLILEKTLSQGQETEQECMIRLGEMTPFGTVVSQRTEASTSRHPKPGHTPTPKQDASLFDEYLCKEQEKSMARIKVKSKIKQNVQEGGVPPKDGKKSSMEYRRNHDLKHSSSKIKKFMPSAKSRLTQKKNSPHSKCVGNKNYNKLCKTTPKLDYGISEHGTVEDYEVGIEDGSLDVSPDTDEEYVPDEEEEEEDISEAPKNQSTAKKYKTLFGDDEDLGVHVTQKATKKKTKRLHRSKDDGSIVAYNKRLRCIAEEKLQKKQQRLEAGEEGSDSESDVELDEGFRVPGSLWKKLYRYQKTGVRWLYELHCQQAGGIVGDEMGLGKTIQMIAFLAGLKYSKLRDKGPLSKYVGLGPTIIIAPATVMHQWVSEFHKWWPPFRVAVLHTSGSYTSSDESLLQSIVRTNGVLVTGYNALVLRQDIILRHDWHYVILDEGHKIRNPDAKITVAAKMFRTCHRIILSGSPMQNNLKELWSLFDFVFPGKLGTLPDFMAHFSVPIVQGGYANATDIQVRTAYKCACILRDTINPYLLRRMKADVQNCLHLPDKNEQVLFCRLTEHQKEVYLEYLQSRECRQILDGKYMVFPGLIALRKICNHPDLCTGGPKVFDPECCSEEDKSLRYGYWKRSGKMIVVESLLKLWKKQGQRVLLFSQSKQMLDIIECFVKDNEYTYMRMDGGTVIGSRQAMIEHYNQDSSIYIFLLTTRVGGLGVNLTGANRVIIFDPDWNPSTDTQARERAWRIGQKRQVTIYRLLTTGTIEEKIYHRQIFKQFLTNRVLKDPKQQRFFKSNDLYDLFTLNDDDPRGKTETSDIFAGTGSEVEVKLKSRAESMHSEANARRKKHKNRFDILHEQKGGTGTKLNELENEDERKMEVGQCERSDPDKQLKQLREMAKKLSLKIAGLQQDESTGDGKGNPVITDSEKRPAEDMEGTQPSHQSAAGHKKKHKHKRKKRDAYLDGEKITHLDSRRVYHNEEEAKRNDDYVLEKLFRKKGLHSAIHHDKIMMASDPDYALVESEAERVAKEAALALKRSRSQCFRANTGIPTWTGQSGVPASSRPRFGQKKKPCLPKSTDSSSITSPTKKLKPKLETTHFDGRFAGNNTTTTSTANVMLSEELLACMKKRNAFLRRADVTNDGDEEGASSTFASLDLSPDDLELITDIRNALAFCCHVDGQATTQEVLDRFGTRVKPEESAKFRAMLQSICDFEKINGTGLWKLKAQFR